MKKENKTVKIQVPVTEKMAAQIKVIAAEQDLTIPQVIRRAITMLIKSEGV